MQKRPLCEMAFGLICGILYAKYRKWYLLLVAGIFLLWMILHILRKKKKVWTDYVRPVAYVLFLGLGILRFCEEWEQAAAIRQNIAAEQRLMLQGRLERKEEKNGRYWYYLEQCMYQQKGEIIPCRRVIAVMDQDECRIGQILVVNGEVQFFERAVNDGNFDAYAYYQSQGIDFSLKNVTVQQCIGKGNVWKECLFSLRKRVAAVYKMSLKTEDAGVLAVMTLGEKNLLDPDVKKLYQQAGISHILAISGLHISMLGLGVYELLRKLRLSFLEAGLLSGFLLWNYGILTGGGTSTIRAVVMFLLYLAAQWTGFGYDSLSALGFSALVLLLKQPEVLTFAGFVFSYMAVLGITGIAATLKEIKQPYFHLEETILTGLSIQLATVPVTAFYYFEVPVWSMILNFFVLPLVGILLGFGLAGGIAGMWSLWLAKKLFIPCRLILGLYHKFCEISQNMPCPNVITGRPPVAKMILYYSVIMLLLCYMKHRNNRRAFSLLSLSVLIFVLWNPLRGFELDMLDVGQGDGIFVHSQSGINIFIDGGSSDVSKVGTYRILPFLKARGVGQIDYWFVSHTDADHISGLKEILLTDYPVRAIVFSDRVPEDDAYIMLTELARDHGSDILKMRQKDAVTDGKMKITCLFPDENYESTDKNGLSLVLYYEENGYDALFTGDIGSGEEAYLLEHGLPGELLFYKAAHHGSNYSNSEAFLEALAPHVTGISCGKKNRYGHPGKDAVSHIKKSGSAIYDTRECGRIRLRWKHRELRMEKYLEAE